MHLENLYLANFKNYSEVNIDFSTEINAVLGKNGSGKTNLLDAIYFLSMTKSAFNSVDSQSIRHGQSFYSIIGRFKLNDKSISVSNSLSQGKRKKLQIENNPVIKAADLIGKFPIVLIAPSDHDLITGTAEVRRRFFDSIISQLDRAYLLNLIEYNHALKQRNKLLKQFAETGRQELDVMEPYDLLLQKLGEKIWKKRDLFCADYISKINAHYAYVSNKQENVRLIYQSQLNEINFRAEMKNSLEKDLLLQRTTIGVHKDDFLFEMDGYPIRKFGSQGQQKSFLIALKLGQFDILRYENGFKPILLMDDIFDKLDDLRIQKLTEMIEKHEFGQVFITDARPERTYHFLEKLNIRWQAIHVENGTFTNRKMKSS